VLGWAGASAGSNFPADASITPDVCWSMGQEAPAGRMDSLTGILRPVLCAPMIEPETGLGSLPHGHFGHRRHRRRHCDHCRPSQRWLSQAAERLMRQLALFRITSTAPGSQI